MRATGKDRLFAILVAAGLLFVSLGGGALTGRALSAESVIFSLDWVPFGKHSGFYTALHKGHYKAEGLDVTIQRGFGSGDTIKRVNISQAHFGFADTASLVVARSRGAKVKVIAMFHDDSLYTVYTLEGSGISKPKDLEGRTIGAVRASASRIIFPAFAQANNVDMSKINWVEMTDAARVPSLLAGKVDAADIFAGHEREYEQAAAKVGKKLRYIRFKDWGVNPYSNGIITADATLEKNPDLVRRFMRATWKGVAYTVEHPDEGAQMFLKTFPERSPEILRNQWDEIVNYLLTPTAKEKGIGYMTRERMIYTRDLITQYMKLEKKVEVEDLYTNAFLPKLFPKRPQ